MMNRSRALLGLLVLAAGAGGVLLACSDDDTAAPGSDAGVDSSANKQETGSNCPAQTAAACSASACATQFGGDAGFCVNGACVQANTFDCPRVGGDLTGSNQVVIGSMLSLAAGGTGITRANSLELAVNEINKAGGIPDPDSCKPARTLAFVECDDQFATGADAGTGAMLTDRTRGGNHLLNDLKVPVIVGGSTSGNTLAIAQALTVPAKAMLFAPSSTAIAITDPTTTTPPFNASPDGTRLLWRAAPSDVVQSKVLQQVYALLELQVKADNRPVRLALVTKNDAYGTGIATAFQAGLIVDGAAPKASSFLAVEYQVTAGVGDGVTRAAAVAQLQGFKPTVVVMAGTSEASTDILVPYEVNRDQTIPPYYLLSDGQKKDDLIADFNTATANNATLAENFRSRLRGTQPGDFSQQLDQNFFSFGYKTAYGASSIQSYGMAGSYDIGYMLGYAIAATKGGAVTGTTIAQNMSFLVGGTEGIDVGAAALPRGMTAMLAGTKIDFNGASGPLDFDVRTGEAPSNYSLWCVKNDPNNAGKHIFEEVAGQTYDVKKQALVGTFACP